MKDVKPFLVSIAGIFGIDLVTVGSFSQSVTFILQMLIALLTFIYLILKIIQQFKQTKKTWKR